MEINLSNLSLFFLTSFSLLSFRDQKRPEALAQSVPQTKHTCNVKQFVFGFNGLLEINRKNVKCLQYRASNSDS